MQAAVEGRADINIELEDPNQGQRLVSIESYRSKKASGRKSNMMRSARKSNNLISGESVSEIKKPRHHNKDYGGTSRNKP